MIDFSTSALIEYIHKDNANLNIDLLLLDISSIVVYKPSKYMRGTLFDYLNIKDIEDNDVVTILDNLILRKMIDFVNTEMLDNSDYNNIMKLEKLFIDIAEDISESRITFAFVNEKNQDMHINSILLNYAILIKKYITSILSYYIGDIPMFNFNIDDYFELPKRFYTITDCDFLFDSSYVTMYVKIYRQNNQYE